MGLIACAFLLAGGIHALPCAAEPLAITPFYTFNQSPLVQIFGLPAAESAIVQPKGRTWSMLAADAASMRVARVRGGRRWRWFFMGGSRALSGEIWLGRM